ncbi:MAG: hypothetical protein ACOY6K_12540 [Pseudomonadota bacterium]
MPLSPPAVIVRFDLDAAPLQAAMAELARLAQGRDHFAQVALGVVDAAQELVRLRTDEGAAAGTGVVRVIAEPGDGLARLVAAARAGNFDRLTVEGNITQFVGISSVGVATADDSRVGGGGSDSAAPGSEGGAA